MLGKGHADHIHRTDNRAQPQQGQQQDHHRALAQNRALVLAAARVYRWLGVALQHKGADANGQQDGCRQWSGLGEQRDTEAHGNRRADNKAHLIEYRLERKRRMQLGRTAVQLGPACPHHGRHAGHAA